MDQTKAAAASSLERCVTDALPGEEAAFYVHNAERAYRL
jgi:hypothetical protein